MLQAIQDKDRKALAEQLKAYSEILLEHIKKEDEILFPWIDRNLSTKQVGQLYSKFNESMCIRRRKLEIPFPMLRDLNLLKMEFQQPQVLKPTRGVPRLFLPYLQL